MNPQLNPQEIETVLRTAKGHAGTPATHALRFDFRRPDRIAKSQLRAIHLLHENFVRSLASSLAAYLRAYVTVNLVSVEQLSYGEFLKGLPSPTCLVSMGLQPYEGNALLELNASLIFPIIEIILGGKGRSAGNLKREITEIEQSLLETPFRIILNDLKEAWKGVTLIDFKIDRVATEPQMLQILAPNEAVVAVGIEIRIGENSGNLNLAIPSINIKMIGQKFDQRWNLRKTEPTEEEQQRVLRLVRGSGVSMDARLNGPHLRVGDLLDLQVGDLLRFDYRIDQPVECEVNEISKFRGTVVNSNRKRGFLIAGMQETR